MLAANLLQPLCLAAECSDGFSKCADFCYNDGQADNFAAWSEEACSGFFRSIPCIPVCGAAPPSPPRKPQPPPPPPIVLPRPPPRWGQGLLPLCCCSWHRPATSHAVMLHCILLPTSINPCCRPSPPVAQPLPPPSPEPPLPPSPLPPPT